MAVPAFANARGGNERLVFGGTTITIRASADTTGGAFTVFEESAPLLDTSAHVHRDEDELYYVLEGDHVFVCGGEEYRLGPGGMVFLPRGVPHAHRRVVHGEGRLLSATSPAGTTTTEPPEASIVSSPARNEPDPSCRTKTSA